MPLGKSPVSCTKAAECAIARLLLTSLPWGAGGGWMSGMAYGLQAAFLRGSSSAYEPLIQYGWRRHPAPMGFLSIEKENYKQQTSLCFQSVTSGPQTAFSGLPPQA